MPNFNQHSPEKENVIVPVLFLLHWNETIWSTKKKSVKVFAMLGDFVWKAT